MLRAEGQGIALPCRAACRLRAALDGGRRADRRRQRAPTIIDINMGCPARHVTGGQSGSALMRDLDHALTLIEATVGAVSVPVTLKMRLGWDDRSINAPELARRAEQAGVRLITVHGRTRCQFYKGRADWARCARSRQSVSVPRRRSTAISARAEDAAGGARGLGRRCGDDRPRGAGPALAAGPDRALSRQRPARSARRPWRCSSISIEALYDEMLTHHGIADRPAPRAQASRLGARCGGRDASRAPARSCSKLHRRPRADRRGSGRRSAAISPTPSTRSPGTRARPHEPPRAHADAALGHRRCRARCACRIRSS